MSRVMTLTRRMPCRQTSLISLLVETTSGSHPASPWQSKIRNLKRRKAAAELTLYQIIDYLLIFSFNLITQKRTLPIRDSNPGLPGESRV